VCTHSLARQHILWIQRTKLVISRRQASDPVLSTCLLSSLEISYVTVYVVSQSRFWLPSGTSASVQLLWEWPWSLSSCTLSNTGLTDRELTICWCFWLEEFQSPCPLSFLWLWQLERTAWLNRYALVQREKFDVWFSIWDFNIMKICTLV
jgi:hypothetical protein